MPAPPRLRKQWKFNNSGRVLKKYWGGAKTYYKLKHGVWKRWLGNQWIDGMPHWIRDGTQWGRGRGAGGVEGAKNGKQLAIGKGQWMTCQTQKRWEEPEGAARAAGARPPWGGYRSDYNKDIDYRL